VAQVATAVTLSTAATQGLLPIIHVQQLPVLLVVAEVQVVTHPIRMGALLNFPPLQVRVLDMAAAALVAIAVPSEPREMAVLPVEPADPRQQAIVAAAVQIFRVEVTDGSVVDPEQSTCVLRMRASRRFLIHQLKQYPDSL